MTVNAIVLEMGFWWVVSDSLLGLFRERREGGNASLDHYLIYSLHLGVVTQVLDYFKPK